jgi:hypothetical protein
MIIDLKIPAHVHMIYKCTTVLAGISVVISPS